MSNKNKKANSEPMACFDPRALKQSAVVEARIDIRVLARIAEGMARENFRFSTKSEMIRNSLLFLHDVLVQNGLIERFETISNEEAVEILGRMGIYEINRSGRNQPTLCRQISIDRTAEMSGFADFNPTGEKWDVLAREVARREGRRIPDGVENGEPFWLLADGSRSFEYPEHVEPCSPTVRIEEDVQIFEPIRGRGSDKERNQIEKAVRVDRQEQRTKEQKEKLGSFTEELRKKQVGNVELVEETFNMKEFTKKEAEKRERLRAFARPPARTESESESESN